MSKRNQIRVETTIQQAKDGNKGREGTLQRLAFILLFGPARSGMAAALKVLEPLPEVPTLHWALHRAIDTSRVRRATNTATHRK